MELEDIMELHGATYIYMELRICKVVAKVYILKLYAGVTCAATNQWAFLQMALQ